MMETKLDILQYVNDIHYMQAKSSLHVFAMCYIFVDYAFFHTLLLITVHCVKGAHTMVYIFKLRFNKIPHTGDKASLDFY